MTQVSLVPILLWVAALVATGIEVWREPRPVMQSFVIDRLLRYLFLFPLGHPGRLGLYRPRVFSAAIGRLDRLGAEPVPI